jgi:hypothetical protein
MKIKLNELKEIFKVKLVEVSSLKEVENLEKEFL